MTAFGQYQPLKIQDKRTLERLLCEAKRPVKNVSADDGALGSTSSGERQPFRQAVARLCSRQAVGDDQKRSFSIALDPETVAEAVAELPQLSGA